MTNRHVAGIFTSGIGTRRLTFKPGARAGIDFLRELDRSTGPTFAREARENGVPLLGHGAGGSRGASAGGPTFSTVPGDVSGDETIQVAAIGYPAFEMRNHARVQNDLFRNTFGVKRLQPGTLSRLAKTESYGKTVDAVRHTCSTLGGNSGSAPIDLDSGKVVALHFGGRYRVINYGVPAIELARDGRIADAGVRFEGTPPEEQPPWSRWWEPRRRDAVLG